MPYRFWVGVFIAFALNTVGCEDANTPLSTDARLSNGDGIDGNATIVVEQPQCDPGSTGCYCATGDFACWDARDICSGGVCVPSGNLIDAGDLNGPCHPNGTCNLTQQHGWLTCQGGLCVPRTCDQGALGCGCFSNMTCNSGLVCEQSGAPTCVESSCTVGTQGCGCLIDNSCGVGSDGTPLACQAGLCKPVDCTIGALDCACYPNYTCNSPLVCDSSIGLCEPSVCDPGDFGCGCTSSGGCKHDTLYCASDGTCQLRDCLQGELGCGCFSDFTCGTHPNGTLLCENNACRLQTCIQGALGCGCLPGSQCGEGATCINQVCVKESCQPGTDGCACQAGQVCNAGLVCGNAAVCQDNTGYDGGLCLVNGTCAEGHKCVTDPVSGQLVCQACDAGTNGCGCLLNDTCVNGLTCTAGTCVPSAEVVLAPNPMTDSCYSTCLADLENPDGTFSSCSSDGLMAGCVDAGAALVCKAGSCVPPGAPKPTCTSDLDCPDFQACMNGGCYSNCETDGDCTNGAECHRKVCRVPCSASTASCAEGYSCQTVDGENGYCLLVGQSESAPDALIPGALAVTRALNFSNVYTDSVITIANSTPVAVSVRIRKTLQRTFETEGQSILCAEYDGECTCVGADECEGDSEPGPLFWLKLGPQGQPPFEQKTLEVSVPAGASLDVVVAGAGGSDHQRWEGEIEVDAPTYPELGIHTVDLEYAEVANGQWTGTMYTFANFPDDDLVLGDPSTLLLAKNAFLREWFGFMTQPNFTLDRLNAMLTAVREGSWAWDSVKAKCPAATDENGKQVPTACYLFSNPTGFVPFSSNLEAVAVPSGVVALPVAMNLKVAGETTFDANHFPCAGDTAECVCPGDGLGCLEGKILTAQTLHYPGDAAVALWLADSSECTGDKCLQRVTGFHAKVHMGGRYITDANDTTCNLAPEDAFEHQQTPWLVPSFLEGTDQDPESGIFYRYECRDRALPYGTGSQEVIDLNLSFAAANPVPDGQARERTLELVDGALINDTTLIVIFRERFPSFFGTNGATSFAADDGEFTRYGFMTLQKTPAQLESDAFNGSEPAQVGSDQSLLNTVSCDSALVAEVLHNAPLSAATADTMAQALIEGSAPTGAVASLELSPSQVHYYCEDTGYFDGGPDDWGVGGTKEPCPIGSKVTWFAIVGQPTDKSGIAMDIQEFVATQSCQNSASCQAQLNTWLANFPANLDGTCDPSLPFCVVEAPVYKCTDENEVLCDANRLNLRDGKTFYQLFDCLGDPAPAQCADATPTTVQPIYVPLLAAIDQAFRYKTKFKTRFQTNVGFTPEACVPNSDAIPYCYAADEIEQLRKRVDCAARIYVDYQDTLPAERLEVLRNYLDRNFSFDQETTAQNTLLTYDGFERLYSELLIMLGDDAYTAAFASRFDLAGSNIAKFEGSLFEVGGIDLSGAAGHEMRNLYMATQYYQLVLDRFFALMPVLRESLTLAQEDTLKSFVTQKTVVSWFNRLVRASYQKALSYGEIAKRYQSFNQPALARRVIERAYSGAYLESMIMARMMLEVVDFSLPKDRDQVVVELEQAQRWYRSALSDMRDVYESITDSVTYFGFAPDYVPFPALDPGDPNAFEKVLNFAKVRLQTAALKEDAAIASNKSYEVDEASFQSELVSIKNTYENQLAEICGTFEGPDGQIYPAIPKYAFLTEQTALLGDPCGLTGNGQLFQSIGQLEILDIDFQALREGHAGVLREMESERLRVSQQCGLIAKMADFSFGVATQTNNLQSQITTSRNIVASAKRVYENINKKAEVTKCIVITGLAGGSDCVQSKILAAVIDSSGLVFDSLSSINEALIAAKQSEISEIQASASRWNTLQQCDQAKIDSNARMRSYAIEMEKFTLQALRAQYQLQLQTSTIANLRNQATRLMDQQDEAEELSINVQAAKNDPNVRIYKNDDIINADRAFQRARREAYRATKVYEYFTSQSYADLEDLFLVRMVQHGDITLENYLTDLEDAFVEFEETYGLPDARVAIVSLRDDVLAIPRNDSDGQPLNQSARVQLFRDALADARRLDENGYLTIPFATALDETSPLTRNHKIDYVEVELVGTGNGDPVGRVYLRQKGTGVVQALDDTKAYYAFPSRTAVVNTFFNGLRVFGPEYYRNQRLQDRPYANTHWELVINRRDELVNEDIDLQSLHDVRVYLHYTDFTAL